MWRSWQQQCRRLNQADHMDAVARAEAEGAFQVRIAAQQETVVERLTLNHFSVAYSPTLALGGEKFVRHSEVEGII